MRARIIAAGAALLVMAAGSPARAQIYETELDKKEDFESPQNFYLEIKLGPYSPDIDSEFESATPFADMFGDGTDLMVKADLEWEFWRPFGTLALAGEAGYYGTSAKAFKDTGSSSAPSSTAKRTAGETTLTLVPMALLLVYRADFLAERWDVPVVPYAKGGINYTLWWIDQGSGATASFGDQKGSGGTFGWQFNAGVALMLDVFEPNAAKNLDVEVGINHTYLFFELAHIQADNFGSGDALHVGDTTFSGGLSFEF